MLKCISFLKRIAIDLRAVVRLSNGLILYVFNYSCYGYTRRVQMSLETLLICHLQRRYTGLNRTVKQTECAEKAMISGLSRHI